MNRLFGLMAALGLALASSASADPWKDESGKSRERGSFARYGDDYPGPGRYQRYAEERVRVPHGHLPPPGKCRTWYPGRPAGHQPPPHRC